MVARFYGALGDPEGHREMFAEVTAKYVDSRHLRLRKLGLSARAWLAMMDGRIADAAHDSAAAMRINLATRETTTAVADIALTPWVLLAVGRPEEAVTVMAALQAGIDRLGISIPLRHDRTFEAMVSTLASTDHDAAVRRGRTMSLDALADFMDELANTAVVADGDVTLTFPPGFGEPLRAD